MKPQVVYDVPGPLDAVAQAALDKTDPECDGVLVIVFGGDPKKIGSASLSARRPIESDRLLQTLKCVTDAFENEVKVRMAGARKDAG